MILSVVRMLVLPVLASVVVLLSSLPAVEPHLRQNTEVLLEDCIFQHLCDLDRR